MDFASLPKRYQALLRETAEKHLTEFRRNFPSAQTGRVTFHFCDLCGYAEWVSTEALQEGIPTEVITHRYQPQGGGDGQKCPKCREIAERAPEIFLWVLNVKTLLLERIENPGVT